MKKWRTLLAMLSICSFIFADELENIEILSSKVVLQSSEGYFALSDGSCWKVVSFSPRWRSPCEWWHNVEIVPESYKTTPADWLVGTKIEIYPVYGNLDVNLDNASNEAELMECTHLLYDTKARRVLFAIPMHPSYCLTNVFTDAHQEGYDKGYLDGRSEPFEHSAESYTNGYEAGYENGYKEARTEDAFGDVDL